MPEHVIRTCPKCGDHKTMYSYDRASDSIRPTCMMCSYVYYDEEAQGGGTKKEES